MLLNDLRESSGHTVFCVPLSTALNIQRLQWLSKAERARAERFRKEEDSQRYILAHTIKRFCLSQYLNVEPRDLVFDTGPKGKPFCSHPDAPFFNISHSGDWVLFGMSSAGEVGVDVESASRGVGDSTAAYVLSPSQLTQVDSADNKQAVFITYWTQKEAITKALGQGLSIDFKTVDCSGQLGESVVEHQGHHITVNSCMIEENYIVSSANMAGETITMYRLEEWEGDIPSFVTL